jgi:Rod binding domain-containing protein
MRSAASSGLGASGLLTAIDMNPMAFRKMPSISAATPAQALKTGQQFETMYLTEMLQPMFEGIKADKVFGGGHGEEMFQSLAVNEYAKAMTASGGVGIAAAVQREILRLQEQSHVPAPAAN